MSARSKSAKPKPAESRPAKTRPAKPEKARSPKETKTTGGSTSAKASKASRRAKEKPAGERRQSRRPSEPQGLSPPVQRFLDTHQWDYWQKVSMICQLFTEGRSVKEILEKMQDKYGDLGKMTRETPYALVRDAATNGYIRYFAPPHAAFWQRITNHYTWLKQVNVVNTMISADVALQTADMLLRLVQEFHCANPDKDQVEVGFAAGLSVRQIAQCFAELLCYPRPNLPKRIVFHAIVTGHDPGNPTTDPNAFFTFFLSPPALQVEPRFVGLHAPAMVRCSAIPQLRQNLEISEAYDRAEDIDIIVTSGSDWEDKDSALKRCMERSEESMQTLINEKTVGDMLWRPLNRKGPITTETTIRALTLVELTDLPKFIEDEKYVLLMLGPCARCGRPKGRLLHTILSQSKHLVSHLVVDSRTAGQLVKIMQEEGH